VNQQCSSTHKISTKIATALASITETVICSHLDDYACTKRIVSAIQNLHITDIASSKLHLQTDVNHKPCSL